MKKSFIFLALSLISFAFFSCSSFQNSSSTVISLSLPSKFVREITNDKSGQWTLKIRLSDDYDYVNEKEYTIKEDSLGETQKFVIGNLRVGQKLKVDVNIYLDNVCEYKTEKAYSLTLAENENVLDVKLIQDNENGIKTAVYFDSINQIDQYYALKQIKDYTDTASAAESIYNYSPSSETSPIYTFDSDRNLYVPEFNENNELSFYKYSMDDEKKMYTAAKKEEFVDLSSSSIDINELELQDIYYADGYLYMLFVKYTYEGQNYIKTPMSGTLYASNGNETIAFFKTIIINSSTPDGTPVNVVPMQIAINGNNLYVAGNDCNIYSTTIDFENIATDQINSDDFTKIASCTESLTDYNEKLHNDGEISITDMQLGDGLGNKTENLYVLVREASKSIDTSILKKEDNFSVVLSRGALIEINTSSKDTKVYGWGGTSKNIGENIKYYGPTTSSGKVEFYGPTHFAAVVPRKLVILDDGIDLEANSDSDSNSNGTVINKDSFVEFDILLKSLKRKNEKISASKPSVSGFTYENISD